MNTDDPKDWQRANLLAERIQEGLYKNIRVAARTTVQGKKFKTEVTANTGDVEKFEKNVLPAHRSLKHKITIRPGKGVKRYEIIYPMNDAEILHSMLGSP